MIDGSVKLDEQSVVVLIKDRIADDTRAAMESNFPPEQLPDWPRLSRAIASGWTVVHELRSSASDELLSARVLTMFPGRFRGEPSFITVGWAVTPDSPPEDSEQHSMCGKNKGYGSYLFQRSQQYCRQRMPHAIGLVGECELPSDTAANADERNKRMNWMKHIGRFVVDGLDFEIPPMPKYALNIDKAPLVSARVGTPQPGCLLITKFDGSLTIGGDTLFKIVRKLYSHGYDIDPDDPYLERRLMTIDTRREYNLVVR